MDTVGPLWGWPENIQIIKSTMHRVCTSRFVRPVWPRSLQSLQCFLILHGISVPCPALPCPSSSSSCSLMFFLLFLFLFFFFYKYTFYDPKQKPSLHFCPHPLRPYAGSLVSSSEPRPALDMIRTSVLRTVPHKGKRPTEPCKYSQDSIA